VSELAKSLLSLPWRLPLEGAERLTRLMTAATVGTAGGSALGRAAATVGRGTENLLRSAGEAAATLQRDSIDLLVDTATARPLVQALQQNFSFLGPEPEIGSQKQPELEYLAAVNDAGPAGDSLTILSLAVAYVALNRQSEGIPAFEGYLGAYDGTMKDWQRGVYLASLGLLRVSAAKVTPIWRLARILELARQGLAEAAEAKAVTAGEPDFDRSMSKVIARWASGLLNAQLPRPLGDHQQALADLTWVVDTVMATVERQAQAFMFLREAAFNLARLYDEMGDEARSRAFLELSTYRDLETPPILLATLFACGPAGLRDGIKHVMVSGGGHVFTVSGQDMSEFNFVITEDGQELVAIDGGTRWERSQAAWEYFVSYLATLGRTPPPLTNVIMTHVHWDHVGGHTVYQRLNPQVKFYSRSNYLEQKRSIVFLPPPYNWFLSDQFTIESVRDYEPDDVVAPEPPADLDVLTIGGTQFQVKLIAGGGGETIDGMFVHMPQYDILFAGDFIVPWIGSPYNPEGDIESLLESLAWIGEIQPQLVLHGHEALTVFFPNWRPLAKMRPHLEWLRTATLEQIHRHKTRQEILEANLTPPGILAPDQADVQLAFILFRECIIDRLYDQNTGYWGPQLTGVDYLTPREFGSLFSRYLGLSGEQLATAMDRMIANGDLELAGQLGDWGITQYPDNRPLLQNRHRAFLMLKQKWQLLNVFKFTMYSEHIGDPTEQLPLGEVPQGFAVGVAGAGGDLDLGYSNASFAGRYDFSLQVGPDDQAGFGVTSSDGRGNFSGFQDLNAGGGRMIRQQVAGTYEVFSNGTGTAHIQLTMPDGTVIPAVFDYVVLEAEERDGVKLATVLQGVSREPAVDPATGQPYDPPQLGVTLFKRVP
jgi:glyoxylase-like metal-dependent hydrolase (beta-lactamase superfamily II)